MNSKTIRDKKLEKFEDNCESDSLILTRPFKKKTNELYLFFCDIPSFKNVCSTKRNLHTLVIIGQLGIKTLDGISNLRNLKELWVVECFVKVCVDSFYSIHNLDTHITHYFTCHADEHARTILKHVRLHTMMIINLYKYFRIFQNCENVVSSRNCICTRMISTKYRTCRIIQIYVCCLCREIIFHNYRYT